MKNIVLTGLSGSGKTTLGLKLAEISGMIFTDTDEYIEKTTGRKISDIFAQNGEDFFREIEHQAAVKISQKNNQIISTGGGMILREDNMQALAENGLIVFIDKDPAKIAAKINIKNRPLLKEGADKIFKLYEDRKSLYEKYGDFRIKNNHSLKQGVTQLQAILKIAQDGHLEKRYGVIGNPIAHSLSPIIHLPVLKRFYPNAQYTLMEVAKNTVGTWVDKTGRFLDGFNITMPFKTDIIPHLDSLTEDGKTLATINTVANINNLMIGHNTDASGFQQALMDKHRQFKGSRITFLGAGGAGTSLALKAAMECSEQINILTRSEKQRQALAKKIIEINSPTKVVKGEFNYQEIAKFCKETEILINATSLGMEGINNQFEDFSFLDNLPENAIVCDLIYNPNPTRLIAEAQKRGLQTLNGLPMLIYQGLYSERMYIHESLMLRSPYERVLAALKQNGATI